MPEYTFYCDEERGGCGHAFSMVMLMCDYSPQQVCPECRKIEPVCRDYQEDLAQGQVVKGNHEITLGELAIRNGKRMSKDEKAHLTRKNNAYKENRPSRPLPDGMSYIDKKPDKTIWPTQRE